MGDMQSNSYVVCMESGNPSAIADFGTLLEAAFAFKRKLPACGFVATVNPTFSKEKEFKAVIETLPMQMSNAATRFMLPQGANVGLAQNLNRKVIVDGQMVCIDWTQANTVDNLDKCNDLLEKLKLKRFVMSASAINNANSKKEKRRDTMAQQVEIVA